jgi:hypothetical protein
MVYEDSASVAVWSLIARDGMTLRARGVIRAARAQRRRRDDDRRQRNQY